MRIIQLFLLFLFFSINTIASEVIYISIGSEEVKDKISAVITSKGGHTGYCIDFSVTNHSENKLHLQLEPGRRLISIEEKFQDIFIVKEHQFSVEPHDTYSFMAYGFCCEAFRGSPIKGCVFQVGYIENKWVDVANLINKGNYGLYDIQAAVWSLSDNWSIHRIPDSKAVMALKEAVIMANPKSNVKINRRIITPIVLMTAQDSIEYLRRNELRIRESIHWQPIGEDGVFDYSIISKSGKGGWKDARGLMSIVGREITIIDSLDTSLSYKFIMAEVKKDTIDFGQGKLMTTDVTVVKRVDIVNDKKMYRFALNHIVGTDFYSAVLTEWNNSARLFNIKVKPISEE